MLLILFYHFLVKFQIIIMIFKIRYNTTNGIYDHLNHFRCYKNFSRLTIPENKGIIQIYYFENLLVLYKYSM